MNEKIRWGKAKPVSDKASCVSARKESVHHDHHIASTLLTLVLNIAVRQGWNELRILMNMALESVSKEYRTTKES